ncbi:hypothetical protein [Streptomyces sp. NPDC005283]|uniref:hypothetical protein n=1 Tax=Streptomyces sp. NPDC005283 TaxID=3156871 RepID=UPI0034525E51
MHSTPRPAARGAARRKQLGPVRRSGPAAIQVTDYDAPPRTTKRSPGNEGARGPDIVRRLAHSVDSTTTVHATQVRAVYRIEPHRAP